MYYSKAHRELPKHYSAVVAKHEVETKEQVEPAAKYRANRNGPALPIPPCIVLLTLSVAVKQPSP